MGSGQWAVHSVQRTTVQRTVGVGQWAVDSGQWTVDSGQLTVDSGQLTVGSGQWTVDSGNRTVDSGLLSLVWQYLYSVPLQNIRFISLQIFA